MASQTQRVKRVVVIAASAGGIDALTRVLSGLPSHLPAAILVVQHLQPSKKTYLPQLLARHSLLRVCLAESGMPIELERVYVAVPGYHLRLHSGRCVLDKGGPVHYVRPAADTLFASAAQQFESRVVGVILSGTGHDGAAGCQEIKAKGGVTIAQNENTSQSFGMAQAAIEAGAIDYVLPLTEIADKIVALLGDMTR